jgi:DNA-binding beta-propeller fold protein YncE
LLKYVIDFSVYDEQPEEDYMKFRSLMTAICILAAAQTVFAAPFAYIANKGTKNISVIDTAITPTGNGSNAITGTVTLPDDNGTGVAPDPSPYAIAVGASGQYVYVGVKDTNEVDVINVSTNTVVKRISLGTDVPGGLAVNAAETRLYVASTMSNTLIVIDISAGARELDRVAVDDATVSNPEGVVLNAAGTKVYVANSTTDKIAEVTVDETNNSYVRTAVISVPSGAPMGLALSTDGTKLYFASFNGNTGFVTLSSSAVTTLTTASGNISVAVNPSTNEVYAPSYVMDQLFAFNSAGTALSGSPFGAASGPFGSSVTPSGAKLFVTMNLNDTVNVYTTTNLGAAPAPITITGAQPTGLGNFIGPAFGPYTIAASATAPCTITPSGSVPVVTGNGWTFTIGGAGCQVTADSVNVGYPTTYKMGPINSAGHTISVSQVTGTYRTIRITPPVITSVGGYLVSTPAGLNQNTTSAQFLDNSSVSINAPTGFKAISWGGACTGTADGQPCVFNPLTADKDITAIVVLNTGGPIKNETQSAYYADWNACYGGANSYDIIKVSTNDAVKDINTTASGKTGYMYYMSNQWKSDFSGPDTYKSSSLTIKDVGVIVSTVAGESLIL